MNILFCADASEQSARVLVEKLNAGGSTDAVNPQIIIPAPNPKPCLNAACYTRCRHC